VASTGRSIATGAALAIPVAPTVPNEISVAHMAEINFRIIPPVKAASVGFSVFNVEPKTLGIAPERWMNNECVRDWIDPPRSLIESICSHM